MTEFKWGNDFEYGKLTVKELIQILQRFPEDLYVRMIGEGIYLDIAEIYNTEHVDRDGNKINLLVLSES